MEMVFPYRNVEDALEELDNGGRFYNFFTKKDDEVVTASELYKAAGVFTGAAQAFLFYELAVMNLSAEEKGELEAKLSPKLRNSFKYRKPRRITPEKFERRAFESQSVILEGHPFYTQDSEKFSGFVPVPIQMGNTTTTIMIPIIEQFHIYEVYPTREKEGEAAVVAIAKGKSRPLRPSRTRFAGVVKEMSIDKNGGKGRSRGARNRGPGALRYLDPKYYSRAE